MRCLLETIHVKRSGRERKRFFQSRQGQRGATQITLNSNKSELIARVHADTHGLDGADEDELDLMLGEQAELRVEAGLGGIKQLL